MKGGKEVAEGPGEPAGDAGSQGQLPSAAASPLKAGALTVGLLGDVLDVLELDSSVGLTDCFRRSLEDF